MWVTAACVVLCLANFNFKGVNTWVHDEAECLTTDGSAGRCLDPSECPPSYSRQKPVLCRYSRGHGLRICCSRSYSHKLEDSYSNDEPIAFPSEFENTPGYHHRPSTNSYQDPFYGKGSSYRPNRPSTNSYDRPSNEDTPGYSKPSYHQPSYSERPSYNNHPSYERPDFNPSSIGEAFGRPDYNGRPEIHKPSYENQPNYGSSSSKPSFGRPNYNERPDFERPSSNNQQNYGTSSSESSFDRPGYNERPVAGRPSSNNQPNYGTSSSGSSFGRPDNNERPDFGRPSSNNQPNYETSSSESSFGRPDYNERPVAGRPSSNNQPNYGTSSSGSSFGRPDYNERPEAGRPSYNNQPNHNRPRPGVWGSTEDSSEEYPDTRRTTARPSWALEDNDEPYGSSKRISESKCEEYSQSVSETISPLPLSIDSEVIPLKVQKCDFSAVKLIVGGEAAELGEFPHMAAIGFRTPRSQEVSWNCGGTLISEKYVMTAAHCVNTTYGKPTVVRLGEYNLERDNDGAEPEDYRIERIIVHPEYRKSSKYNDIALLQLSQRVSFNKWVRPACLSTETRVRGSPTATGWGRTHFVGKLSDILMKVNLNIIENQQCNTFYRNSPGTASFSSGITETMLCAGDLQGGRDTCLGDSGGPLSVTKADNPCVHYVVGVTSFGKICGAPRSPGVYTRVSKFVPWIERTVWPSSK